MPSRPPGPRKPVPHGTTGPDAPERVVGVTLADRYRLERPIGSGGMGTVFLAEHVLIHKPVAIKVLSPEHSEERAEVERFLGEARAASRIRHEHVVDITDFGSTDDGRVFLVMEYLEGEDLATTCERDGAMPWRRAAAIVLQIAAALEAAHAQGIVHRDMKPENCFRIRRGNDPDFIKVLDFGIARMIDENRDADRPTNSGLTGTPEYLAPELVQGKKGDARVDIYATGAIFYRLLTGRVPFLRDSVMATLTAQLMEAPEPPSQVVPDAGIPAEVEDVVLRALAKDPGERFATIGEFAAALRAALAAVEAAHAPTSELPERGGVHPRVVLAVVVTLIVLFAAVLWYVVQELQSKEPVAVARAEPVAPLTASPPAPIEPPAASEAKAPAPTPELKAEPTAEPEAPAAEPAEPEPAGEGERSPPAAATKRPRSGPEKLSAMAFAAGMTKLAPRVKLECSRFSLRKMAVTVEAVVGPDGRVKSAEPTGSQAGSTLGYCVARVVKTAVLGPARAKSSHRYTFTM